MWLCVNFRFCWVFFQVNFQSSSFVAKNVNLKPWRPGGNKQTNKRTKKLEFKMILYLCHGKVCTGEVGIRRWVKSSTVEHLNSLMLEAPEEYKTASWKPAHPAQPVHRRAGHPGPPWTPVRRNETWWYCIFYKRFTAVWRKVFRRKVFLKKVSLTTCSLENVSLDSLGVKATVGYRERDHSNSLEK